MALAVLKIVLTGADGRRCLQPLKMTIVVDVGVSAVEPP